MNFIRSFIRKRQFGTGALKDPQDLRDYTYRGAPMGGPTVDWNTGYDVEKVLDIKINIKHQGPSSSCVGQGWSYYVAVLDAVETGYYSGDSAKAIYSQIFLPSGGAYIRDGGKILVDWGAVDETMVRSSESGGPPSEAFMRRLDWKNTKMDDLAKILQSKEYRVVESADNMDMFASAILNNHGIVGGVNGENNGSWHTNEPKPPIGNGDWAHCIYFGKFGTDELGRYIATPNSWGTRNKKDALHPDDWQKLRSDYFKNKFMFNPWTLTDRPNVVMSSKTQEIMDKNEKKIIIEGEGPGRKGVVVNGRLLEITKDRAAEASLYVLNNNGFGVRVNTVMWNEMAKGPNF